MRKILFVLGAAALALGFLVAPANASQTIAYSGDGVNRGAYVLINCYPFTTEPGQLATWRSDRLPLSGSVEYGAGGYVREYSGEVQCTGRVWSKNGKLVGYTSPVNWRLFV